MLGLRPLSSVGAELEYLDFGASGTLSVISPTGAFKGSATTHPKAPALFGVGYLPIPVPHLDVFGKAGVAKLKPDAVATGNLFGNGCFVGCDPVAGLQYAIQGSSTRFAYGGGVQVRLGNFALRAEYERISANTGDPALLSLGLLLLF